MPIGIDALQNAGPITPPNEIRPQQPISINPTSPRARSGKERGQHQPSDEKSAFRAVLDAVAGTDNPFSPQAMLQARRAARQEANDKTTFVEKLPTSGPAEIAADQSERLYVEKRASPQREAPPEVISQVIPSSPEFFVAASRYAERFFSVQGPFAKPGESLEIKA